ACRISADEIVEQFVARGRTVQIDAEAVISGDHIPFNGKQSADRVVTASNDFNAIATIVDGGSPGRVQSDVIAGDQGIVTTETDRVGIVTADDIAQPA